MKKKVKSRTKCQLLQSFLSMKHNDYIRTLTETMESLKQRLFRYASYRVGNTADAEDILQNVYLNLIERKMKTATPGNLQAYIFRSVVNACNDHRKHAVSVPLPDYESLDISEEPTNFEEEAAYFQILIDAIPELFRDFIRLRIYADMTFDEIADTLGVSATTAKRRYYEGLDYLRLKYEKI